MYGRGNQLGFGPPVTPPIIKNLIIANAAVFVAQVLSSDTVTYFGVAVPVSVWLNFEFWRPFTYMWLHGGFFHLAFNMLALWMFGSQLALVWGEQRFLRYYLICGVGAGVLICTVPFLPVWMGLGQIPGLELRQMTLGASGAVMGALLAFSFTWPDRTIMLIFPPIPIKALWLIPLLFVMEFSSVGPSNVSHLGHLGGVIVGWIYLVKEGRTPGAPTLSNLKLRWQRYQMRQKLRSVRDEEERNRRRRNDRDRFH